MTDTQPTGNGASVTERLESILSAGSQPENPQQDSGQAAPNPADGAEAPAGDEPKEDDGPQYELSEVAKILGLEESMLDVDEDGSLKIRTKVDGKEGAAKLHDLLKSYQVQGHADAKARQAAEQERAVAQRAQQFEQYAQAEAQRLGQMAQVAQALFMQDAQSIDWDRLSKEDPIEYTAKRHEFERRQGQVNQLLQAANQQQQMWQVQRLHSEAQRLPQLLPQWADPQVAQNERLELAKWLHRKGASPQAIATIGDAGVVAALHAAWTAEKAAPKTAATEKLVRSAPKLVKPGQPTDANQRKAEDVRELKQQIRESGGKRGVADYLIRTGKV